MKSCSYCVEITCVQMAIKGKGRALLFVILLMSTSGLSRLMSSSHVMNLSIRHDVITNCKQLEWTVSDSWVYLMWRRQIRLGYVRLYLGYDAHSIMHNYTTVTPHEFRSVSPWYYREQKVKNYESFRVTYSATTTPIFINFSSAILWQ